MKVGFLIWRTLGPSEKGSMAYLHILKKAIQKMCAIESIRLRIGKYTEDEKELYRQGGWKYVTKFGEFTIFSSATELNAPELHTDPAEQAQTLNKF